MISKTYKISLKGKYGTGKTALVDQDIFYRIKDLDWFVSNEGYAYTTFKNVPILMHRLIAETPLDKHTDHLNHNTLDNRKINLKICSRSENMQNRITSSGHAGHLQKSVKKYKDKTYISYMGVIQRFGIRYYVKPASTDKQIAEDRLINFIKEMGWT